MMQTGLSNAAGAEGTDVEFVLIAEAGILEAQALMLCESIRAFGGVYAGSPITVVSPRADRRPATATVQALERLGVEYLAPEIDSCCPDYGTSYRIHIAAMIERRPGPSVIVQLDSDTIFVSGPDPGLFDCDATARPVDVKGMCTTGPGDPFDGYWRRLCDLAEVDYERLPMVRATVSGLLVKASYNGGFLATRRSLGLFGRTEAFFRKLVAADLPSWTADGPLMRTGTGFLRGASTAYWGTSQAAFSLSALATNRRVRLLPASYNVPLHSLNDMSGPLPNPLVHLHYHWLFANPDAAALIADPRLGLSAEVVDWLKTRLPLQARQEG